MVLRVDDFQDFGPDTGIPTGKVMAFRAAMRDARRASMATGPGGGPPLEVYLGAYLDGEWKLQPDPEDRNLPNEVYYRAHPDAEPGIALADGASVSGLDVNQTALVGYPPGKHRLYILSGVVVGGYTGGATGITGGVDVHSHRGEEYDGTPGLKDLVEEMRFEPGLVVPYSGLTVHIYPFFYWHNGVLVFYPGGYANLTSYVPSTSGRQAWALVGVDPATNTATAVQGTEYATAVPLTRQMIADIDPGGIYPCDAVKLKHGQTSIVDGDIKAARVFLSAAASASAANPGTFQARLTTATGVPVVMSDETAQTALFLTPYKGNQIALYNGSAWENHTLSELTILLTITYSGDTTSGSPVITGLGATDGIHVGSEVTGTGIPAGAVVQSIDSATQVTLDQNATATGSGVSLTFFIPADTAVDVFVYDDDGTLDTECVFWTDTSTRATALTFQDGVYVKSGATGFRYAGSFCTTGTDAQTEDSSANRLVYNYYNRRRKDLDDSDATSHNYGTATWREWNSASPEVSFFLGVADQAVEFGIHGDIEPLAAADAGSIAVGVDGSTSPAADRIATNGLTGNLTVGVRHVRQTFGVGYHYLRALEYENAGGSQSTFDYVALQGSIDV